jgi:hypothetical protein
MKISTNRFRGYKANSMNDADAARAEARVAQRARSTGSRKLCKWARALASSDLGRCVALLEQRLPEVHPADWVAAYILLCLSCVFPAGCIGGRRGHSVQEEDGARHPRTAQMICAHGEGRRHCHPSAVAGALRCADVCGLVLSDRDIQRLGGIDHAVVDVFARFELLCVPPWVNRAVVAWANGLRPLVLMTRVASVEELLFMQGQGRRCVTCFCKDLGREIVDSYPPFAVKDCLHFVFHDLQHVEKLVDPELYCEQVGFLHEMRKVWARSRASNFRVPMDLELRRDIAHVVSDMNCCSVQMLDFLLARWQGAAGETRVSCVVDV